MQTSENGMNLIKRFEGLRLTAYQCSAGVWTIGYGHTANVRPGLTISASTAEEYLRKDIAQVDAQLNDLCRRCGVTLTQNQHDALASFVFNLGIGSLSGSTLWKRICTSTQHPDIPNQFMRWVYAKGQRLPGLEKRRAAEAELYTSRN